MSTYGGIVIVSRFVTVIISMQLPFFVTDTHINAINLSPVVNVRRRAVFATPGCCRSGSYVDVSHGNVALMCPTR